MPEQVGRRFLSSMQLEMELPRLTKWHFTGISSSFFDASKEKLERWNHLVSYAKLAIAADPVKQGFRTML